MGEPQDYLKTKVHPKNFFCLKKKFIGCLHRFMKGLRGTVTPIIHIFLKTFMTCF